jgi:predicted aspartyl protease
MHCRRIVGVMDGCLARVVRIALFLNFAGSVLLVSANAGIATPLHLEKDGGIVIPVRLQGEGPYRFRLDTGASRTVISGELARGAGLTLSGSSVVVTSTARTIRPLAAVRDLFAGCLSAAEVQAVVVPAADLDPAGQVVGLIGQDVLADHVYTLDYARRELRCQAASGESVNGVRLPLSIVDGRALVSLPQAGGALRLVPDSGADHLVLFTRPGQPLTPLVTPLDTVRARSVNGQRLARRVLVQALDVGGSRLRDQEGLLLEAPGPGDLMGDGLLPLHLFSRVTFDGPGGYALIEPRR